ncbi:FMN-binding glutamate synthase family protein [Dethiobacter alkaliphilus]|uniref:Ferredoxin-dependent glutamate synthase n=1 Tax=Dethiobacter alkaliphilus AHT 1 TaxID=555088 RepID=C0GHT4_DETAL|nr:FMN-binding glutamate synthase family protein [Dethiobacter alkaliphilus]EEG77008.1 ferredoxin-dependent glutamate synthase [Dethiobacter alkaliphilus AHT 1]
MSFSRGLNASKATFTKNRTPDSVSPFSGLCTTCLEGCPGLCEVGKSAFRGREVLYPQPYGTTTFASEKDYPVDFSHFNIMGTAVGAQGIEADSDKAIFPAASVESKVGVENPIKLKVPFVVPGLGSTKVAADNWEDLAAGCAISGAILTIGENVCGMDPESVFKNGKVVHSPNLKKRVQNFRDWQDGYGEIVVQSNVEDTKLGVLEYAIGELGVKAVELKWGQGAKNIGGEVKVRTLEEALTLKKRGYVVYPDPEDLYVQELFKAGSFKEFERHSRVGMVTEESFLARVDELRNLGAEYVFLKTGAYRPADLARAVKYSSKARIDMLTIDGAGGGTGMSPWRMMNEWGVPTVYLQSLLYNYLERIRKQGEFIPNICVAGGFSLEDHIYKGFALAAPYVNAIGMARAPLTAVMVGKTMCSACDDGKVPADVAKKYGTSREQVFNSLHKLKGIYGNDINKIPAGALGLYTYFDRLQTGMQQLMCGSRKFALEYITRDDLVCLTREAADVSGIPFIMDADNEEADRILSRSSSAETYSFEQYKRPASSK